jgi:DNA-binding NarL/FixJ family response regulator
MNMNDTTARILIVDDEPLNVDYLEQELESHGFRTEAARNGLEALDRIAEAPPDLVLLDVMMPELDGIQVLRILKEDPETKFIPVVLMTALNSVEDRVRGIEAGADDFLSKPVDERELLARIGTALTLKRAIDSTVGELRSASTQLEQYGRLQREVAVLAVEWRQQDGESRGEVLHFLGRRERDAVARLVESYGGSQSECAGGKLIAIFDGPDVSSRAVAAVEAGLAVAARTAQEGVSHLSVGAAVAAGPTLVGSTRVEHDGVSGWVYRAEGTPVDDAWRLARGASAGALVITGEVAASVNDRFRLEPVAPGEYSVLATSVGAERSPATYPSSTRRLRTIVFTDIVGSTMTIEQAGDRAGGELLAAHVQAARSELVLFGGEEIDAVGDGFVASFDSAARGIRYALALVEHVASLGLTLRAGIHTGELELVDDKLRGIALHLGSRIAARAAPGEVLVSATTADLASGSELSFADRGEHALRGLTQPSRLFAAGREGSRTEVRPPLQHARTPAGLTAREVDVLRLVAAGLSDAEVAQHLFLSVRTVHAHLRSIYRKAKVRSRAAAGRFAEENGLL